ncbi:MarR family winged helix-turn-helix transcriptional regulator [Streptomyces sp. NBC_01217]|uniref:MarR family winged helix-turn-helix transcriptional regulator n=1 Tax=Streptomyces sp. NBC_01217 TaxID=2903779 RepID=UPI002E0EF840|nr:MarR family transcriptional regulator [Streptomyces sp. NBC_01217]
MTADVPLDVEEERFWRALQRVITALPNALDKDLLKSTGLTLSEYTVLMFLSEAENRELRVIDLAELTRLSASRISRVVDALKVRGWVTKRRHEVDARGSVASLTPEGMERLEGAYPSLLTSSRRRVMDHVNHDFLSGMAVQFERVADHLG